MAVHPTDFIAISGFFAVCSLYVGLKSFKESRTLRDSPLSTIRAAAHGYVELQGRLSIAQPIETPLLNQPCCFYRLVAEERVGDKDILVCDVISSTPFLLDDGTGQCTIEPSSALQLHLTAMVSSQWKATMPDVDLLKDKACLTYNAAAVMPFQKRGCKNRFEAGRRYTWRESYFPDGASVLVCGTMRTDNDGKKILSQNPDKAKDKSFLISSAKRAALVAYNKRVAFWSGVGSLVFVPLTVFLLLYFKDDYFKALF